MSVTMHGQRGQTLPIAALGIIVMLAFGYFALDYANTLRWQIRAQNAADSAAQAILSLQTQQFNEMTAVLYASAVEEYRLRRNLNAMIMAANGKGGCTLGGGSGFNTCTNVYATLQPRFMQSVARYSNDVQEMSKITATMNVASMKNDGLALLTKISGDCVSAIRGDCAFHYVIPPGGITPREDTQAVKMDALRTLKPSYGTTTGPSGVNDRLLAPLQVEVDVCATVPPVLPGFFGYTPQTKKIIGRGAATSVMMEQDWLQPGTIVNAQNNKLFQPIESYIVPAVTDPSNSGYDWYNLDFGGNGALPFASNNGNGYQFALVSDELSAQLGWWNSAPMHSFLGPLTASALGCG